MSSDWIERLPDLLPPLLRGLLVTLEVTAVSALIAFALSFVVGMSRLARPRVIRGIARAYVEVFRGTSALVQLFYCYFVLPFLGIHLSAFAAAVLALSVNSSAYGSEIVRSAIRSIDRGQLEAAAALNLSDRRTMTAIVLPQAALRMLPPFGNLLVEHLKATSLVSLITVTDLAFAGQSLIQERGQATEVYLLVLLLYFCVCFPLSRLTRRLERRFGRGAHETAVP